MRVYLLVLGCLGHGLAPVEHLRDDDSAAFAIELVEMLVVHVQDRVVETDKLLRDLHPAA